MFGLPLFLLGEQLFNNAMPTVSIPNRGKINRKNFVLAVWFNKLFCLFVAFWCGLVDKSF